MRQDINLRHTNGHNTDLTDRVRRVLQSKFQSSKWLIGVSPLALVACGGSIDSSDEVDNDSSSEPAASNIVLSFKSKPVLNFDVDESIYSGNSINAVIVEDLNKNGDYEIIFNVWWGVGGQYYKSVITEPTPDLIVAYMKDEDGVYVDATESLFDSASPGLGGATMSHISKADINGDGVNEYLFTVNWEDLRSGALGYEYTNASQQAFLLSNSQGKYEVVNYGLKQWGSDNLIIQRGETAFDLLTTGVVFEDGSNDYADDLQVFRYDGVGLTDVQDEYSFLGEGLGALSSLFDAQRGVTYIAKANDYRIDLPDGGPTIGYDDRLSVFELNGEEGSLIFEYNRPSDFIVYRDPNEPTYATGTWIIDDYFVADLRMEWSEFFVEDTGRQILFVISAGAKLADGVIPFDGYNLKEDDMIPYQQLQFFTVEDGFVSELSVKIEGEVRTVNASKIDIVDLNSDGHFDIVIHNWARPNEVGTADTKGIPIIYLNDGTDNLTRIDPKIYIGDFEFLENSPGTGEMYQSSLVDLDNDGNYEILQFPHEITKDFELVATELIF